MKMNVQYGVSIIQPEMTIGVTVSTVKWHQKFFRAIGKWVSDVILPAVLLTLSLCSFAVAIVALRGIF